VAGQPCPEAKKVSALAQNAGDGQDVDEVSTQASEPLGFIADPAFFPEQADACLPKALRRGDTSAECAIAPQRFPDVTQPERHDVSGLSLVLSPLQHSDCEDGDAKVKVEQSDLRESSPSNCEVPEAEAPTLVKEGHYIVHQNELPGTFLSGVTFHAAPRSVSSIEVEADLAPDIAKWGTVVVGTPCNDDWLAVGGRFLPIRYHGANVLKLLVQEVSGDVSSPGGDRNIVEQPSATLGLAPWRSKMTCCPARREASVDEQCFGC